MSFIKYPGGKSSELKIIRKYLPENIRNYYEPFVGGGAVYFDIDVDGSFINDKSEELIWLYRAVKTQNIFFFKTLNEINSAWVNLEDIIKKDNRFLNDLYIKFRDGIISDQEMRACVLGIVSELDAHFDVIASELSFKRVSSKGILGEYLWAKCLSMKKLEQKKHLPEQDIIPNIEGGLKAGLYMYIRSIYNTYRLKQDVLMTETNEATYKAILAALYVFIRETTYSAMFRYNRNGEFNVPYGGISYNKKNIAEIIKKYKEDDLIKKLSGTVIECMDFRDFFEAYPPEKTDFIFVDPPYDSEFSEYDQLSFGKTEHEELASYLINECKGNFMLVIKNTDFINSLYKEGSLCANGNSLSILCFDKKYAVSFMNRNSKDAEHLIIRNY